MSTAEAPWDENSFYFSLFIFYLDRQLLIGYQREAWTVTVWWERALTFTSLGNVRRPIHVGLFVQTQANDKLKSS